jgi:hypothetical protein
MSCQGTRINRLLAGFAALTVVAGFLTPSRTVAQTREQESKRVYSAAFDFLFHDDNGESPGVIILLDSALMRPEGVAYRGKLLPAHRSRIDAQTISDFEKATVRPAAISLSSFSYRIPIVLLSLDEFRRLDAAGAKISVNHDWGTSTPGNFIDALAQKYPKAWGMTAVSSIGMNRNQTQALVLVRHNCGWSCFHEEALYLAKVDTQWAVRERIPVEKSDGLGPGAVRYLGPDPVFLSRLRKTRDSTRKAIADSIAQDALPRRIHGIALNHAGNNPIANAQVFLQHHPSAGTPEELRKSQTLLRTVADSSGQFEFLDPPVGITTLILECPAPKFSMSIGLDMRVTSVTPGHDTPFNLVAPNIGPCWKSHRYFALESGWLESSEARSATAPTLDEEHVMSAAIAHLRSKRTSPPIVAIQSRTITRCRGNELCGSIQFDRMKHDHVARGSTIDDFKMNTDRSVVLNPAFGRRMRLPVVTEDEMHYLSTSAFNASPISTSRDDSSRFWEGFRQLHGGRSAIVSFSRAGFDKTHSEALLEVSVDTAAANWWHHSRMMLLRRSGKRWTVVDDDVGKAGTRAMSGQWEGGKCVAVKATEKPPRAAVDALLGVFDVTLVYADQATSSSLRVRIGQNLPPRWTPAPNSRSKPGAPLPRSYEVIDKKGYPLLIKTEDLSIKGIPRNIIHDPDLIRLDGYYQNLLISNVDDSGFYGSFVDGVFGDSGFGYFCARRVLEKP